MPQNYTTPTLDAGTTQYFNASVYAQEYASGGAYRYQKAFIVILTIAFVMNAAILANCLYYRVSYADFSEPTTLFWLAANSPASGNPIPAGSVRPTGDQFRSRWRLKRNGKDMVMEQEIPLVHLDDEEQSTVLHHRLSGSFELGNVLPSRESSMVHV